jgi:hypothetical protein
MLRPTEEKLLAFCLEQVTAFDASRWRASPELERDPLICACAYLKTTDWYPRAEDLKLLPTPKDWLPLARKCHFDISRFKHRLQFALQHLAA